jgi:hypothetical protein
MFILFGCEIIGIDVTLKQLIAQSNSIIVHMNLQSRCFECGLEHNITYGMK